MFIFYTVSFSISVFVIIRSVWRRDWDGFSAGLISANFLFIGLATYVHGNEAFNFGWRVESLVMP